jgi:hypothetical protein
MRTRRKRNLMYVHEKDKIKTISILNFVRIFY